MNISGYISFLLLFLLFPGTSGLNGSWKLTDIKYVGKRKVVNTRQTQPDQVVLTFQDNGFSGSYNGKALGESFGAKYEIRPNNKFSFSKSYTMSPDGNSDDNESIYELCDNSHFSIISNTLTITCPGDTIEMVYVRTTQ